MIIYEITAIVRSDLVEHYERYMREQHIPDLLATGHFRAVFLTRAAENRYRIQYHAHDRTALEEYLRTSAAALRSDFLAHLPEGVELSRENWEILQVWQTD